MATHSSVLAWRIPGMGDGGAWWAAVYGVACNEGDSSNAGDVGSIPGLERSLGEGNGNLSSILVWEIPWTEEPGGLQSMGSKRI